jgi:hypothetical protein
MPQRSPKDMSSNLPPRTLFEKVWDAHVVKPETPDAPAVLCYLLGGAITAFERARGER